MTFFFVVVAVNVIIKKEKGHNAVLYIMYHDTEMKEYKNVCTLCDFVSHCVKDMLIFRFTKLLL